jgi:hypothetical protein
MKKLMLLSLTCGLLACSDGKTPSEGKTDAGAGTRRDAGSDQEDEAGETAASSGLERAPGALPRPPSGKLPDDLKPPGFGQ